MIGKGINLRSARGILRRSAAAITAALRVAAGTMLALSVVINFANIIGRYVFSVSLY